MQHSDCNFDYVTAAKRMVRSYLKYTDHPILLVTNKVDAFSEEFNEDRVILSYMPEEMNRFRGLGFDYTLKLEALAQASLIEGIDAVYWVDADSFTTGWDEDSFQELLSEDNDVIINGPLYNQGLPYFTNYRTEGKWLEEGEVMLPCHHEDRVLYNNMEVMREIMIVATNNDWDALLTLNPNCRNYSLDHGKLIPNWRTKEGSDGILMGVSMQKVGGKCKELVDNVFEFMKFERMEKRPSLLNPHSIIEDRFRRAVK